MVSVEQFYSTDLLEEAYAILMRLSHTRNSDQLDAALLHVVSHYNPAYGVLEHYCAKILKCMSKPDTSVVVGLNLDWCEHPDTLTLSIVSADDDISLTSMETMTGTNPTDIISCEQALGRLPFSYLQDILDSLDSSLGAKASVVSKLKRKFQQDSQSFGVIQECITLLGVRRTLSLILDIVVRDSESFSAV